MRRGLSQHRRMTRAAIIYVVRRREGISQAEIADWIGVPCYAIARMLAEMVRARQLRAGVRVDVGDGRRRAVQTYSAVHEPRWHGMPAWAMPRVLTGTPAVIA